MPPDALAIMDEFLPRRIPLHEDVLRFLIRLPLGLIDNCTRHRSEAH